MIHTYTLKQRVLNLKHDNPGRMIVVALDSDAYDAVCHETDVLKRSPTGSVTAIMVEGVTVRRAEIYPPKT